MELPRESVMSKRPSVPSQNRSPKGERKSKSGTGDKSAKRKVLERAKKASDQPEGAIPGIYTPAGTLFV